jgi:hypothetical protein
VVMVLFLRRWSLLRYLEAFGRVITTACWESNPLVNHLSLNFHIISLLSLACTITLDGMGGWNEQGKDEES